MCRAVHLPRLLFFCNLDLSLSGWEIQRKECLCGMKQLRGEEREFFLSPSFYSRRHSIWYCCFPDRPVDLFFIAAESAFVHLCYVFIIGNRSCCFRIVKGLVSVFEWDRMSL